jgi:hypothetical protein
MTDQRIVFFSGEDIVSEAAARRCTELCLPDFDFHSVRPLQGGREGVLQSFQSYVKQAEALAFFVLLDQDDYACPPSLRNALLQPIGRASLPRRLVVSIATREVESWVLSDRTSFSDFFGLNERELPTDPERLEDPKRALVHACRKSKEYYRQMCPPRDLSAKVGPGYNDLLCRFIEKYWRPEIAAVGCPSLKRTIVRLSALGD